MTGRFRTPRSRFLAECFSAEEELTMLLANHGADMDDLYRWLRGRSFRRKFRRLLRSIAAVRDLELSRGSVAAARKLRSAMNLAMKDFTERQRKVCADLIRLSRERARPNRRRAPADAPPALIAPGLSTERAAELIELLSRP